MDTGVESYTREWGSVRHLGARGYVRAVRRRRSEGRGGVFIISL